MNGYIGKNGLLTLLINSLLDLSGQIIQLIAHNRFLPPSVFFYNDYGLRKLDKLTLYIKPLYKQPFYDKNFHKMFLQYL